MDLMNILTHAELAKLNALLEYRLYDSKASIDAALARDCAVLAVHIWNKGSYDDYLTTDMLIVISGLMNLTRSRTLLQSFYDIVNAELNSLSVQLWGYEYDQV